MKIAVLDDWLDCAKQSADWDRLGADVAIDFFQDTVTGSALVDRLQPYDILCVMRERSLIDATLIAQLPNLKAIVTSGMRNAAIDLDAAKAIVRDLLESDERVLQDKPILVELGAMADSSVNLTTRAWVKAEDYWSVHYSMNENVYKTFNAKGISIPYPQMDVHLHK